MARPRAALLVFMLSMTWLAIASTGVSAGDEPASGEAPRVLLRDALEALRQRGLPIVFSSSLVPGDLEASAESVAAAGAEDTLRGQALALLGPHRLTLEEGPQGTLLVVRDARRESKDATRTGTTRTETGVEDPNAPPLELAESREEIVVTTPYTIFTEDPGSTVGLTRQQISELPHFGDDLNRAVRAMPSTSGHEGTARFNVRGGLYDEVLVAIDSLELYAPFHLEDLQGIFSIVDPEIVDRVDLYAGSFSAIWGDRMTAVLDIRTRTPSAHHLNAGISFSNAWVGGSRLFASGKGRWLASGRRGYLDLVLDFIDEGPGSENGETPDPRYWDAFSKLEYDLSAGSTVTLEALLADDSAVFRDSDDPADQFSIDSRWANRHAGLIHQQTVDRGAFFLTTVSAAAVDRDRIASERAPREAFDLRDERRLDVLGARHDWTVEAGDRNTIAAGAELRRYEADYDYANAFDLPDAIDDPRFFSRQGFVVYDRELDGDHTGVHASDRVRLGRLSLELGGRFDRQSWLDDDQWSPRLGAAFDLGHGNVARMSWGRFFQSQRPHELPIEFGDDRLFPAQESTHASLGFERQGRSGSVRADVYQRRVSDPHPRYETLFDPFVAFPEVAADRILIEADSADSRGVEVVYHRRGGERLSWWAHYGLTEVVDRVDGADLHRSIDQRHSVTANLSFKPSAKWSLDGLWTYHTGWPTTTLSGEVRAGADGGLAIVHHVGPFYEERLDDYHRLDLRASRSTRVRGGELRFFVDVQNLYDRQNDRGRDLEDEQLRLHDGVFTVVFPRQEWFGIIPSFGVSWRS